MEHLKLLHQALHIAEAALADIGDADREPGDDLKWCEERAAAALPAVREALKIELPQESFCVVEGWEDLAWQLCAEENGEEACTELVWEGGPIPEPWGDRWMKYEGEAKRMIALVAKHAPGVKNHDAV